MVGRSIKQGRVACFPKPCVLEGSVQKMGTMEEFHFNEEVLQMLLFANNMILTAECPQMLHNLFNELNINAKAVGLAIYSGGILTSVRHESRKSVR